jgi:UDP-glucose 4-epimerase
MKILVTGGAGFIGSNLIKHLITYDNLQVFSLDNYSTGFRSNEVTGCTYVNDDLLNIDKVFDIHFDVIFHLAALARISPSFIKPHETFISNVNGTESVLEYARKHGSKVIFAGSSSRWHDPHQSPYATSKYIGEELCKMYRKSFKLKVQIARFYNVYGPNEITTGDYRTIIGVWRDHMKNNNPLTIIGDGDQRRDFTFVGDIVDGLIRIMNTDFYHEDAWELGTGLNYSINEIYTMFEEKYNVSRIHLPDQPGNYRVTLREHDDTLTKLDWQPTDQLKKYIHGLHE